MSGNDVVTINAFIAIIISAIGSFLSYFLSTKKAEKDAQRDYDYAAKTKLYANYEPLVFQFHQLCESAYERICDLVEHIRRDEEKLPERESGIPKYVMNTAYRIMAPLAVFKLMEQRLTEFDIKLDDKIKYEYLFGKALFNIFRNDKLRKIGAEDEVDSDEAIHSSELDKMCGALVNDKEKGSEIVTIKSIGEFANLGDEEKKAYNTIFTLLKGVSPDSKKIFWRNLLGYAYICRAICTIGKTPENIDSLGNFTVPPDEFYWHNEKVGGANSVDRKRMFDIIDESFEYAREHLRRTVKGHFGNV